MTYREHFSAVCVSVKTILCWATEAGDGGAPGNTLVSVIKATVVVVATLLISVTIFYNQLHLVRFILLNRTAFH